MEARAKTEKKREENETQRHRERREEKKGTGTDPCRLEVLRGVVVMAGRQGSDASPHFCPHFCRIHRISHSLIA
jgi:hypothetical protein